MVVVVVVERETLPLVVVLLGYYHFKFIQIIIIMGRTPFCKGHCVTPSLPFSSLPIPPASNTC